MLSLVDPDCPESAYTPPMPKLWTDTVETHRREVRGAILDTTAGLVDERGLRSVTMSEIAEATGIGRATLYKYFSDVEAILVAWHGRQIHGHFARLGAIRDQAASPGPRLRAVLEAYAFIARETHGRQDTELTAFLHRDAQIARAQRHLRDMIRDLISAAAQAGDVRDDVVPDELAEYCLHALGAAGGLPSKAAVGRLVAVTLSGLRR